jgi:uncharacterized protein YcfJ
MNRLMVNALNVGIAAALAMSLAACNRNADAGTSNIAAAASAAGPGGAAVLSGAAGDSAAGADNGVRYAQVVSVDPVRVNDTGRVCHDETVTHTAPPQDQHRVAGTVIGAVAGGLLGHMVGGGRGNTLTTVAGAAGGGYVGNRIEASHQQGQVTSSVQRTCSTVSNPGGKIIGYDVRYVYNGVTRTVRMDHDPGNRVQVQEGVVAVSDAR